MDYEQSHRTWKVARWGLMLNAGLRKLSLIKFQNLGLIEVPELGFCVLGRVDGRSQDWKGTGLGLKPWSQDKAFSMIFYVDLGLEDGPVLGQEDGPIFPSHIMCPEIELWSHSRSL